MKLKVCGMRDDENIRQLMELKPDFMGMIFYPKSARYVTEVPQVASSVERVGVFVNEETEEIIRKAEEFGFKYIQLHGKEPVEQVKELKEMGFTIIKVFSVDTKMPLEEMKSYYDYSDYFLFDTRTPQYGGSGVKFDWSILQSYDLDKPFFLSGGIDLDDIVEIKRLNLPKLYAVDINSRFEISPAMKDIKKIKAFKELL
ncbi:MAG: phosphoribosylanthranilate isomerase [Marinoscillum sp.]